MKPYKISLGWPGVTLRKGSVYLGEVWNTKMDRSGYWRYLTTQGVWSTKLYCLRSEAAEALWTVTTNPDGTPK